MNDENLQQLQQLVWSNQAATGLSGDPCPHCGGLGLVSLKLPIGHEAFGRAFVCVCQRELHLQRTLRRILADAGDTLPDDAAGRTLDDFPEVREVMALYLEQGELWEGDERRRGLYLFGSTGAGKSTLASILLREKMVRGEASAWVDYRLFVRRVQATYDSAYQGPPAEAIIGTMARAPFLVVDDLGDPLLDRPVSPDRADIVFQLIHQRAAHDLPTVVTSNLDMGRVFEQFGSRIGSRIHGLCAMIEMVAVDRRVVRQGVRG